MDPTRFLGWKTAFGSIAALVLAFLAWTWFVDEPPPVSKAPLPDSTASPRLPPSPFGAGPPVIGPDAPAQAPAAAAAASAPPGLAVFRYAAMPPTASMPALPPMASSDALIANAAAHAAAAAAVRDAGGMGGDPAIDPREAEYRRRQAAIIGAWLRLPEAQRTREGLDQQLVDLRREMFGN